MYLPECQQLSKQLQGSAQTAYAMRTVHVAAASFSRELPGRTLAGGLASSREHENTSRERCGSRAAPIFDFFP